MKKKGQAAMEFLVTYGWADSGTNVPLSSSTASAYWAGYGSDSHPFMN